MSLAERGRQRVARGLAAGVEALALRRPEWGLPLAARLGELLATRLAEPFRAPDEADVRTLFGPLDDAENVRVRREISSQEHRNAVLRRLIRSAPGHPVEPLLRRVEAEPLLRLLSAGTPVVTLGWHQGPTRAHSAALLRLGIEALIATTQEGGPAPEASDGVQLLTVGGSVADARFVLEARQALEAGRVVGLNLDWRRESGQPVAFLGRRLHVASGPALLVRAAGARLVPVTRRWCDRGAGIEVVFHEPLPEPGLPRDPAPAFDAAVSEAAAAWFERYLRAHPGTLRVGRLRDYARMPAA